MNQNPVFTCVPFGSLDAHTLYDILRLRLAIFAVEQLCSYQDCDGHDLGSHHIYTRDSQGTIVAYSRIIPPDVVYPSAASIGRVVVHSSHRQLGLGRLLMLESMYQCSVLYPSTPIEIEAQLYLSRFYQRLGFVASGKPYLLDGIHHIDMRCTTV
jgi:ElaA protein